MRAVLIGLTVLLMAATAGAQPDTMPPPPPGTLNVSVPTLQPTGALFKVTWEAVLDPPANSPVPVYRWTAGFNDGSEAVSGAVAGTVLMLRLPYHPAGARPGFVCVLAVDAAGNVSVGVACATLAVPAKPSTTHTVEYREPTTKADGKPLQGLASIRLYWRVDGGPETAVSLPVSSPKGGVLREYKLTVPATSGTLSVTLSAVDASGNESARTAPITKTIVPPASN